MWRLDLLPFPWGEDCADVSSAFSSPHLPRPSFQESSNSAGDGADVADDDRGKALEAAVANAVAAAPLPEEVLGGGAFDEKALGNTW